MTAADEAYDLAPEEEPARPQAQSRQAQSRQALTWPDEREGRLAMAAYLSVPFLGFVVPLVVYLTALRRSPWLRAHAAQALNVWITVCLYNLSIALMGTMLALDSLLVAVYVAAPVLLGLWVTAIVILVRAAVTASHGDEYAVPRWLCSRVTR
jgi:hypothetical protein